MSYGDYTHCAICDSKVFYDAETDYDDPRFGAMVALCATCVKTHTIDVRPALSDTRQEQAK